MNVGKLEARMLCRLLQRFKVVKVTFPGRGGGGVILLGEGMSCKADKGLPSSPTTPPLGSSVPTV